MVDVLGPCPAWCGGIHPGAEEDPVDQGHQSASITLDVPTSRGTVSVLEAFLCQYPNAVVGRRDVYAAVDLGADFPEMGTDELENLAAGLEAHAARLRQLGQQLAQAVAAQR
ncbi:hypothetical protein EDD99_7149 [Streptomyces sp. 846.5]|nr:hypothetical protein [Streptomyces sp. 846.5]TDT95324.1 hypothetical protein EDD99_7149 [Streptomyces sp. 846.5]